jgi:hypothetical protein
MAIDPMLYEKVSGRKGDPQARLGSALAKESKMKQDRDGMPKGFSGGLNTIAKPGMIAQIWYWFKDRTRSKGD